MLNNELIRLIKDIDLKQNANNIAEVDSIFSELGKRDLILELIACAFSIERSPDFLFKYYKYWNYFKYIDWIRVMKKLKNDRIGSKELIIWMYNYFLVDITSIALEDTDVGINVKDYIRSTLFHKGKLKIGVSRLMQFSLPDEKIIKYFGVSKSELRKYGENLIEQGAAPRDIKKETIFTGNEAAKVSFESILSGINDELRTKYYNNPALFSDADLLNDILENADKELANSFLDENPFIRKLLIKVSDRWVKKD